MTEEQLKILKLSGYDWLNNAMVCKMGEFEIATPSGNPRNDSNTILVLRKGKPVFYRCNSGTDIFSPKLNDASFDKVMVEIWHGGDDDDVKRIWYQTIGTDQEVLIYDINFDGQPDYKGIYKNNNLSEIYEWKNEKWFPKKAKEFPNQAAQKGQPGHSVSEHSGKSE